MSEDANLRELLGGVLMFCHGFLMLTCTSILYRHSEKAYTYIFTYWYRLIYYDIFAIFAQHHVTNGKLVQTWSMKGCYFIDIFATCVPKNLLSQKRTVHSWNETRCKTSLVGWQLHWLALRDGHCLNAFILQFRSLGLLNPIFWEDFWGFLRQKFTGHPSSFQGRGLHD